MNQKKKVVRFDVNARAFANVMAAYRNAKDVGLGCVKLGGSGKGPSLRDPATPNLTEFRADVEKAIESVIPKQDQQQWFYAAYVWFDGSDAIQRGAFAEKLLGRDRHRRWEQKVGAKFTELDIYPSSKYFGHMRTQR